jgi:hypothetical protein
MPRLSVIVVLPMLLAFAASDAQAARPLLAELLARTPVKAGEPAMSQLALETCLRKARELDATGTAIDYEIAALDRETAEAMFLENRINAEIPALGGYDEPGLNAFQRRVIRHNELAEKFKAEFPLYQQRQKAYDAAVAEFDRDCAQGFHAGDLGGVKAKLGIK